MPLTRAFKDTVQARAEQDTMYRANLLADGVQALIAGDLETGTAAIRYYINATIGFDQLAEATGTPSKSLMRMFSPRGNPKARNLIGVIGQLQRSSGSHLHVRPDR